MTGVQQHQQGAANKARQGEDQQVNVGKKLITGTVPDHQTAGGDQNLGSAMKAEMEMEAVEAMPVPGCDKCPKLPFCTITLEKELEYFTIGKLSKKIGKFMEAVNAMMNEKGGGIIIHVMEGNQNLLGHLDQKIDDRLVQLIPDDSLFHDKFERYFYDRSHIVYRVKPGPKDRHISTLYFNSKVSVNKGKADPSHAQMRALMTNASKEVKSEQPNMKSEKPNILFSDGKQVKIKRSNFHEPFQESMLLQAKSAPNLPAEEEHTRVQELMKYCWERVRIQEYISAFSKIPKGGVLGRQVRLNKFLSKIGSAE
nr:hypothetical protein BaRGS_011707 [Batillaria attramentaria]KAG5693583.1 hypothetical protein BaRGS_011708 [Batillaria attramentaria]